MITGGHSPSPPTTEQTRPFDRPRAAYRALLEHLGGADAVVLVDGGTDIGSVAAAVRGGEFDDVRFTERTRGSELFVNPLTTLYFCVDLPVLARANLHLDRLEGTVLMRQISSAISSFRDELPRQRPPRAFPH